MNVEDRAAYSRQKFLSDSFEFKEGRVLEIGPLNKPLIKKERFGESHEVFYLDHLSTENLKIKYDDNETVNVDDIVSVDYVCPHGDIVEAVAGNKFDCVVASHVIEHAPNFLGFLKHIHDILLPGGVLVLVVPDKRFTFDLNRPVTTFGAVLENFLSGATSANIASVYDQSAMAVNTNGHNVWRGIINSDQTNLLASEAIAWEAANRVHKEGKYYDVHVNIFTPESFFSILKKTINHEIVLFEVEKFEDTQIGQIEFMVALKKPEKKPVDNTIAKYLATIPTLPLESLLSPYMPQVNLLSEALEKVTETNQNLQNEIERLRDESVRENVELAKVKTELIQAQKVLNRKSVRLTLSFVDKIYSRIFKLSKN